MGRGGTRPYHRTCRYLRVLTEPPVLIATGYTTVAFAPGRCSPGRYRFRQCVAKVYQFTFARQCGVWSRREKGGQRAWDVHENGWFQQF